MWTGFKRIVRSGFVGFWRNTFVSLASVFVMTVALFVIGSTMLLGQLLDVSLQNIQDKVDINVYFTTDAAQEDIDSLKNSVESLPEVESVTLTTREQALDEFKARHQDDELTIQALEELDDNPLGASLAIRAKDTTQYQSISDFLSDQQAEEDPQSPVIDRVNYVKNKEAIEKLSKIIDAVNRSSLIVLSVLIAVAVLITFNTIRLAIYTSREEISVMRLVGASNAFIRGPFMLQGVMYGFVSGVVALLILYPIVLWLGPKTAEFFQYNLFDYFVGNFAYIFSVLVGVGIVVGLVSSVLAVSRYLRT